MLHYGLGVSVEEVKVVILIEVGIEGDAEQPVLQSGKNLNFTNQRRLVVLGIPKMHFAITLCPENATVSMDNSIGSLGCLQFDYTVRVNVGNKNHFAE